MAERLRVGLAGLGTVGMGVLKVLATNAALIERRAGRAIEVIAVAARDHARDRGWDMTGLAWERDAVALADRADVDAVVEVIGGTNGPALSLARATLAQGKPLVTANKAMLAHHGLELAGLAEAQGTALKYEAAVAGGIPVIKGLREGAAANTISHVYGVLNGTCNYILSTMEAEGRDFAAVLAEAQALGYAEADPSFDIDGIDTAHKLSLLASLAFGTAIALDGVAVTGIRNLLTADIAEAAALGHRIRLVGQAELGADGLFQRVHPCLVPMNHPLAHVSGAVNAVGAEGDFVGRLLFQGRGAGEGPTASAVVADLIDLARGETGPAFAMPVASLSHPPTAPTGDRRGRAYLRFEVADRPGVLAELATAMRDAGVSIESLIQRGATRDGRALIMLVTHDAPERAISGALQRMGGSPSLLAAPVAMPILSA